MREDRGKEKGGRSGERRRNEVSKETIIHVDIITILTRIGWLPLSYLESL